MAAERTLKLRVLLPIGVLLDEEVAKVSGEGTHGSFTLLPRHIDFVTRMEPGLVSFIRPDGTERYLATDEGILAKKGQEVLLSVRSAAEGADLGHLRELVEQRFQARDEQEVGARSALARLEASFVRRFLELDRGQT